MDLVYIFIKNQVATIKSVKTQGYYNFFIHSSFACKMNIFIIQIFLFILLISFRYYYENCFFYIIFKEVIWLYHLLIRVFGFYYYKASLSYGCYLDNL